MVKLPIIIQIEHLNQRYQLASTHFDLVQFAIGIVHCELIAKLLQLGSGDISVGENLFLNVVHIIDEALESNEFLKGNLAFQVEGVDTLEVLLGLVQR